MSSRLELWGGAECSVVRVRGRYRDQIAETGHEARLDDYARMADLGITTVRLPLLWEKLSDFGKRAQPDWAWADQRVTAAERAGLAIIAGLVHHGSGPRHTSLVDPGFPDKLAAHAGEVAARYRHIAWWTPVNEPLTTARFSGLYGFWYPHGRGEGPFVRALLNQCLGIARSMAAIRASAPGAKLVQTEDYGRVFATRALAGQARFENTRRLLSLDLLTGRVTESHPAWRNLMRNGATRDELADLAGGAGMPDIIGINHYLTSDRYLDERLARYPGVPAGGNGVRRYVDTEAVRVAGLGAKVGPEARLREIWQRYGLPMAVTEVHNGCTREEQLRWLHEVWTAAERVRAEGADIRAVTLWTLFGAVDWTSLLTREEGRYEAGAFEMAGPEPRPTIVAQAARSLGRSGRFDHPILATPGWWRRPTRFHHRADVRPRPMSDALRPVLITGATGTLGRALARIAEQRGLAYRLTGRAELDILDPASIAAAIEHHRPWAIVNAAGHVRVADAEREPGPCFAANRDGALSLARAAVDAGLRYVAFSSDLVFDGKAGHPYLEDDAVSPVTVYGRAKAEMEAAILSLVGDALILRTSAFFGPWDRYNFVWAALGALGRGARFEASTTSVVSPTYVPDLCHRAFDLLVDNEQGLWHVANAGETSWHGLAESAAALAGIDGTRLQATRGEPTANVLGSSRGGLLRPLDEALGAFVHEREEPLDAPLSLAQSGPALTP